MRAVLSVLLGIPAVFAFVLMPARANIMVSVARNIPMSAQDAYNISAFAGTFDKCNPILLDFMGDMAFNLKNYTVAEWAYNQGIACSPQQATFHFKKAVCLINEQKDYTQEYAEAIRLEPANLYFKELLSKK